MPANLSTTDGRVISATSERLFQAVEALFGRSLTEAERLSFTTRLAGINTTAVAPGDLITADLFNALRADINDLALRLAVVEQGYRNATSSPIITGIGPEGLSTGSNMTVIGRNLTPSRLTLITVGGVDVPIDRIISGSDTVLVFPCPPISGLTDTGAQVRVRIANGAGDAERSFFIRGAPIDLLIAGFGFGSPGLRLPGGAPLTGKVTANTKYELFYTIRAFSNRPESFAVSATITPNSGGWNASIMPGDETIAVLKTVEAVERTVRVRVLTGARGSASIKIKVSGITDSSADRESDSTKVTIDDTGPEEVTNITFGQLIKNSDDDKIGINDSTVYFGNASGDARKEWIVEFNVNVKGVTPNGETTFQVGDPLLSGGDGWAARLDMPPSDRSLTAPRLDYAVGKIFLALKFTGTYNPQTPSAFDRTVAIPVTALGGTPTSTKTIYLRRRASYENPTPA